jgi:hypothetical protein
MLCGNIEFAKAVLHVERQEDDFNSDVIAVIWGENPTERNNDENRRQLVLNTDPDLLDSHPLFENRLCGRT